MCITGLFFIVMTMPKVSQHLNIFFYLKTKESGQLKITFMLKMMCCTFKKWTKLPDIETADPRELTQAQL